MKKILIILILFSFFSANAQHSVSAYGGWTASKIYHKIKPNFKPGTIYYDLYRLPILHAYYVGFEYEYNLKPFRVSAGLSQTIFGTSAFFFKEQSWPTFYWNIPISLGLHWQLPKNFGVTIETGLEIGLEVGSGIARPKELRGIVTSITGIEGEWKQFRLGVKLHLGLTEFMNTPAHILRHTALTTYIGYTIWDSEKMKKKKAKKRREELFNN